MTWADRIELNPEVLVGKPVVKGTRIAVEFVLDMLANGTSEADILANYPRLTHDDVLACVVVEEHCVRERRLPAERGKL